MQLFTTKKMKILVSLVLYTSHYSTLLHIYVGTNTPSDTNIYSSTNIMTNCLSTWIASVEFSESRILNTNMIRFFLKVAQHFLLMSIRNQ